MSTQRTLDAFGTPTRDLPDHSPYRQAYERDVHDYDGRQLDFSERCCQSCGEEVSTRFRRVFGDNDDVVHRCRACSSFEAVLDGAAGQDGDGE